MENLGHVRVQTMRDFIEKNKDYFIQRKIKTLKKQEAIDVIKNKFNEGNVPANIMKEWERITVRPKTIRGLKSSESPMKSEDLPRRKGLSSKPTTTVKRSRKQSNPQRNKKTIPQQIKREELKRGQTFAASRAREQLITGIEKPLPKAGKTYLKRNI
jgi:hypothetical protein